MDKKTKAAATLLMKGIGLPEYLFMRLLAVYFLLSDITILWAGARGISARKNYVAFIGLFPFAKLLLGYAALFVAVSLGYCLLDTFCKKPVELIDPVLLIVSVMFFSCSLVFRAEDFFLAVIVSLFALVFVVYGASRIRPELLTKKGSDRAVVIPVAIVTLAVLIFLCDTSLSIHRTYGTTTFDMGIFEQMFYGMTHGFTPVTTCERGYALSHFRVHGSFILYLLLPVYAVFPCAESLIVSQAVLVCSGVIPVYLITRERKLEGTTRFCCCMIYLFSLGILSPCYFHFHENAFLPPLLLWLFYAAEKKKAPLFYVVSALVCLVKEDATLFVICICLFLAFETKGKERIRALITGGAAFVYFLAISAFLAKAGDGNTMMASRMNTLMVEEDQGALAILGNILTDPGHALTVFVNNQHAFLMLLEMMVPILFLPFVTKKTHRLILVIPFLIFNLIFGSTYIYASQIRYHYAFGTATLLLYLALINLSDIDKNRRSVISAAACAVSVITAVCMLSGNLSVSEKYRKNREVYREIETCLETIPEEASVTSSDYYLPHLADRKELYVLGDENFVLSGSLVVSLKEVNETDYYVIDLREDKEVRAMEILKSMGYTETDRCGDYVVIFRKT